MKLPISARYELAAKSKRLASYSKNPCRGLCGRRFGTVLRQPRKYNRPKRSPISIFVIGCVWMIVYFAVPYT